MPEAVDAVLTARRARGERPPTAGVVASLALHALVVALVVLVPRLLAQPRKPMEYVPIAVIPVQALGTQAPQPPKPAPAAPEPKKPEPPAPEPPKPEPKPETKPEPEPPKAPADVPVLPNPDRKPAKPEPKKPEPKAPPSPTAGTPPPGKAQPAAAEPPGRAGIPTGTPGATSTLGTVGVEDPNFTYGYYLEQLLTLIRAQWVRPPLGQGVEATVHFVIQADGTVEDVEIVQSSGYSSFDLAALRAVQSASPLPPLPRSYKRGSLGVNLIVR